MEKAMKKIFFFDIDGTLAAHRTWISEEHLSLLDSLKEKGAVIVIVGAGRARRIFTQMREYPCDVIGNYGLQFAGYSDDSCDIEMLRDTAITCDTDDVCSRVDAFRRDTGYTNYTGDGVYFYPSGLIRIPLLGRSAFAADKMELDPDKSKRCALLPKLKEIFSDYNVFVAGSTSFDLSPKPYDKLYAIRKYCEEYGVAAEDAIYFGDNYKNGGNDQCVFESEIESVAVDSPEAMAGILERYIG